MLTGNGWLRSKFWICYYSVQHPWWWRNKGLPYLLPDISIYVSFSQHPFSSSWHTSRRGFRLFSFEVLPYSRTLSISVSLSLHPCVLLDFGCLPKHIFQVTVSFCAISLSFSLSRLSLHCSEHVSEIHCSVSMQAHTNAACRGETAAACVCVCGRSLLKDPSCSWAVMLNLQCSSPASTAISPPPLALSVFSLHHPRTPFSLVPLVSHTVVISQSLSFTSSAYTRCVACCVSGLKSCGVWSIRVGVVRRRGVKFSFFCLPLPLSLLLDSNRVSHGTMLIWAYMRVC